ncbi:hypothetical protein [Amycolatopsis sp. 195334CR]|uniref:hypothetical protein n=1 Tax=Amycolatopsis sp. 195334CR TaxID=2814588 RepID=UPI001A9014CF|nr:hypothetical protein [Amycolatopsis sp. 195334CR]MBN6034108.1 hypothetical protein [Amycolatopsis sp. 195334CR]
MRPYLQQFIQRACGCGCGEFSDRDFLPGHDVRAMQQRVRTYFDGSPKKFLRWVDSLLASSAAFGGRDNWPGNLMPELFNEDGTTKQTLQPPPPDTSGWPGAWPQSATSD